MGTGLTTGRIAVAEGVVESLAGACARRADAGHILSGGDLSQMAAQKRFLIASGLDVGQRDVYPVLKNPEDFKKALALIFENKIAGWWNLENDIVSQGVCPAAEFGKALAAGEA